jgi:phosphatidylethanolamine-binding protein (PEBP) family uncharacterized protein
MSVLGWLLRNRHCGATGSAWHRPNLGGPDGLEVSSWDFGNGESIPKAHAGKRVGGENRSPDLIWGTVPDGTAELLLVVEDLDVPTSNPAVHCLALLDPETLESRNQLRRGGLDRKAPAAGVRLLRSTIGRGYHGPEPIKGHGAHRYTFQLFALGDRVEGPNLDRARPRALLAGITAPVIARGRITGTDER